MKKLYLLAILFTLFLPAIGFSQTAIEKLKDITNTLVQPQDTSKKSSGTGGSNLAVSDEGASGGKGKSNARIENPIDKLKKNLTEKAVKGDTTGTPGGTSNLAVSDEGASGKGKNSNNKTTETTGTTPAVTDPPKTGTMTEGPK